MGLGNCEAILTLAVPHFREVSDSPTAGLRQEGSSRTGWGTEEKGKAQKRTSLSYGLDNNQMRRQMTFAFQVYRRDAWGNLDFTRAT